jgi:hypothetical protein
VLLCEFSLHSALFPHPPKQDDGLGTNPHTVKKVSDFPDPSGMSLAKLWPGIIKFFLARESLVIPAGDGEIIYLF